MADSCLYADLRSDPNTDAAPARPSCLPAPARREADERVAAARMVFRRTLASWAVDLLAGRRDGAPLAHLPASPAIRAAA